MSQIFSDSKVLSSPLGSPLRVLLTPFERVLVWVSLSRKSPPEGSIWKYVTEKRSKLIQCLGYFYVLEETLWAGSPESPIFKWLSTLGAVCQLPSAWQMCVKLSAWAEAHSGVRRASSRASIRASHCLQGMSITLWPVSLRVGAVICHSSQHLLSRGSSPGLQGQWWV